MNTITETNKKGKPAKRLRIVSRRVDLANRRFVNYPELRMGGRWLHENGFYIGQYVRVVVEEDRLILIREPYEKEPEPVRTKYEIRKLKKLAAMPPMVLSPERPHVSRSRGSVPYATGHAKKPAKGLRKRTG